MLKTTCFISFFFLILGQGGHDLEDELRAAAAYRFGDSRASLQRIEDRILLESRNDEFRAELAGRMAKMLSSDTVTLEGKRFFCRQLGFIGAEREVPALAALLENKALADEARFALETIPGEASAAAMRQALGRVKGPTLEGLILALGNRRDEQSVERLARCLKSADRSAAAAALTALGKIKGDLALGILLESGNELPPELHDTWSHALLSCGLDLFERGERERAAILVGSLLEDSFPDSVRRGAFLAILGWDEKQAQARVLEALHEDDSVLTRAALGYLQEHDEPEFTGILAENLASFPESSQVSLFQMLLQQGRFDSESLDELMKSDLSEEVRRLAGAALLESTMDRLENLALKATAESPDGLDCDGAASGDQAGIDGDPATYWDETDNQPLYRYKVSFDTPEEVSALRITGWSHHDFAPRDFDLLFDGREIRKVRNAVYRENRLWVLVPRTSCRTVELRITGYYGLSPAIRELEIFNLDASFPVKLLNPGRPLTEEIPIPLAEYGKIEEAAPDCARAVPGKKRRLLVFSRSWGYKHSAIPYGDAAIEVLSRKTGAFEAVITCDLSLFEKECLGEFDAVFFNNTNNEIFLPENFDKLPPEEQEKAKAIDARLKRNLVEYLWQGGGLAVIHAGVASFRKWPEFGEIIGARFDNHPWNSGSTVTLKVDDSAHPAAQAFVASPSLEISDEIYQLKGNYSREKMRVLISLDMEKTAVTPQQRKLIHRADNDFPISYVKSYGQGRIFYCALGHQHELFWNRVVLQHYLDGIQFVLGDLEGNTMPSREAAEPDLSWRRSKQGLALLNHGRIVWQLLYDQKLGKAYFHPLSLLDGAPLTWLRPPDHVWHRALGFNWKFINGLNYWEISPDMGRTDLKVIRDEVMDDFSARVELQIDYHPPGKAAVLKETRTLIVSPPDAAGRYTIDWQGDFLVEQDLELNRTPPPGERDGKSWGGYAGMSVRLARETGAWKIADSEGRTGMECHRQPARWIACGFTQKSTKRKALIAILDFPLNRRHPPPSFIVLQEEMPFVYYSPALLFNEPLKLSAGENLQLRYQLVLSPGHVDRDHLDREWKNFAEGADHEK